jgi:hypothetical protein
VVGQKRVDYLQNQMGKSDYVVRQSPLGSLNAYNTGMALEQKIVRISGDGNRSIQPQKNRALCTKTKSVDHSQSHV